MPQTSPLPPEAPAGSGARILFLGRPSDVFGAERTLDLPPDGQSVGDLRRRLAALAGPEAGAVLLDPAVRAAVDDCIGPDSAWARPGQEVLFFSVFSGG